VISCQNAGDRQIVGEAGAENRPGRRRHDQRRDYSAQPGPTTTNGSLQSILALTLFLFPDAPTIPSCHTK
jgi:hypothetical protein